MATFPHTSPQLVRWVEENADAHAQVVEEEAGSAHVVGATVPAQAEPRPPSQASQWEDPLEHLEAIADAALELPIDGHQQVVALQSLPLLLGGLLVGLLDLLLEEGLDALTPLSEVALGGHRAGRLWPNP